MWPFLLGHVFFRTVLPCSGGYHLEIGGMPLHNAVRINCEKGVTTKNQVFGLMGVCFMIVCVLFDLT